MSLYWDWQRTIHRNTDTLIAIDSILHLRTSEESIVGYRFSEDIKDKVASVDGVSVHDLTESSYMMKTTSKRISLTYRKDYLKTLAARHTLSCWHYPGCECCLYEAEYEIPKWMYADIKQCPITKSYLFDSEESEMMLTNTEDYEHDDSCYTRYCRCDEVELPKGYERREGAHVKVCHDVHGPTVWVLGEN